MEKKNECDNLKIWGVILILIGMCVMFFLIDWINKLNFLGIRRYLQWIGPLSLFFGAIMYFRVNSIKGIMRLLFLPLIIMAIGNVLYTFHQIFSPNFKWDTKIIIFIYLSALYILFLKGKEQLETSH